MSSWPDDAPRALGLHRRPGRRARPRTRPSVGSGAVALAFALRGRLRRPSSSSSQSSPSPSTLSQLHRGLDRFRRRERLSGLAIRLRRVDRPLAHDLARVAAALEPLERRLADVAVAGPATDLRADDELRPDPADAGEVAAPAAPVVRRGRRVERRARPSRARRAAPRSSFARPAVEPGPDLAREPQLVVLVDADDHGPQLLRAPLPRRPAADDQLLLGPGLDLQPRRGARGRARSASGDASRRSPPGPAP